MEKLKREYRYYKTKCKSLEVENIRLQTILKSVHQLVQCEAHQCEAKEKESEAPLSSQSEDQLHSAMSTSQTISPILPVSRRVKCSFQRKRKPHNEDEGSFSFEPGQGKEWDEIIEKEMAKRRQYESSTSDDMFD